MIMSTMLTTPLNNLVRFTKVRPPLVIFVLCLIVITLSCFWFAFYIDHDYGVLNNDEQQNWAYFFKYMNRKDYCLSKADTSASDMVIGTNKIQVPATLTFPYGNVNVSNIVGYIPIDDWTASCENEHPFQNTLKLAFNIPEKPIEKKTTYNICVIIEMPSNFLLPFNENLCKSDFSITGNLGRLTSDKVLSDNEKDFCDNGSKVKLELIEEYSRLFNIYLTESEKVRIVIHLLWLSSCTLFVILMILCYSMCIKTEE